MNNAIFINLTGIVGKEALHALIKEAFNFPDYYGANLDALYDMLTTLEEPRHLELCGIDNVDASIRTYVPKLERVLEDAAKENPKFTYGRILRTSTCSCPSSTYPNLHQSILSAASRLAQTRR